MSDCYLTNIVLEGKVVIVEMSPKSMPPFYGSATKGSDSGDGSKGWPVKSAELAEEVAVAIRDSTQHVN